MIGLALVFAVGACQSSGTSGPESSAEPSAADPTGRPYAGLEKREIKALAPEQIDDLLAGRGAGYALAAELNHYPGPTHVLELAEQLGLDDEQQASIATVKAEMQDDARRLGRELVDAEAELDKAFAARDIDEREVNRLTGLVSDVEGRLRARHLTAHLETRALLSDAQVAHYDQLRGYAASDPPAPSSVDEGGHGGGEEGGGEHGGGEHGD